MSRFGDTLKALIESNQINIYAFAKSANIERTQIHHIITGGRVPAESYVNSLAEALPLSPSERRLLLESYNISKTGEHKYYRRQQVKKLIESIAILESGNAAGNTGGANTAGFVKSGDTPAPARNMTVRDGFAVGGLIHSLLDEALTGGAPDTQGLDFFIPGSYGYFYDTLLTGYMQNPAAQIRHIIPFVKNTGGGSGGDENLVALSRILPFVFAPGDGYFPYYYYQHSGDAWTIQAMPYFILTRNGKLLLLNMDFTRAALICDSDTVGVYRECFEALLKQTTPLLTRYGSLFEYSRMLNDFREAYTTYGHWIEPAPCVTRYIDDEIIENHILPDVPRREQLVKHFSQHCAFLRDGPKGNKNICTTEGLHAFIRAKIPYNVPPIGVRPLDGDTVKRLLGAYVDDVEDASLTLYFTDPAKFTLPRKTGLFINKGTGIMFVTFDGTGSVNSVRISESGINEAFYDFADSIADSGLVCGAGESLNIMKNIVSNL